MKPTRASLFVLTASAAISGCAATDAESSASGESALASHVATTPGVVRGGQFILRNSNTTGVGEIRFNYGNPGDVPIVGDWDGDGVQTPGVFRNGTFYLRNSNSGGGADIVFDFGLAGDVPVVGDWDGDGSQSIGVYRHGHWYLRNSNAAGSPDIAIQYGLPSDVPVVGDWDGNGTDTVGVVRNGNNWILRNTNEALPGEIRFIYGNPSGDTPVAGDWDGDGVTTAGMYRGGNWSLRNSNTTGAADVTLDYGLPSDIPIPGSWQARSGVPGRWYLDANGYRLQLDLGRASASLVDENGVTQVVDNVAFDRTAGILTFRRNGPNFWQWYRVSVVEGTMVGRFVHQYLPGRPATLDPYTSHVTGHSPSVIDGGDIVPRAWDVSFQTGLKGKIRIDRRGGGFIGRFKVYGSDAQPPGAGPTAAEELEDDITVTQWDGTTLQFQRTHPGLVQTFTATVSGRAIGGTYSQPGGPLETMTGTRADVLGFGLAPKAPTVRSVWETKTRRRIAHLIMQDNPAPLSVAVSPGGVCNPSCAPFAANAIPPERDDDWANHGQSYTLRDLVFDYRMPNPYGGSPVPRQMHGWLATPTTPPPPGGYPAALVLNGHDGSAHATFEADNGNTYYYGDAFARRGYAVLAIDVDHRPPQDRPFDYGGSGSHPSVKTLGGTSDWEEDGERAWDAMRGIDYLASLPGVNTSRLVVTGHSMGGEVTSYVGALDPRARIVMPSGYSPDLDVMFINDNHRCWPWWNAEVREYIDAGDLEALVAPRALLVQSGQADPFFSRVHPIGVVKQVWRRVREGAYADAPASFVMYSHPGPHQYWFGDKPNGGLSVPFLMYPLASGDPRAWQDDATTLTAGRTLFDDVATFP